MGRARKVRLARLLHIGRRDTVEIVAGARLKERLLVVADLVGQDRLGVVDEQELLAVVQAPHVLLRQDVALLLGLRGGAMRPPEQGAGIAEAVPKLQRLAGPPGDLLDTGRFRRRERGGDVHVVEQRGLVAVLREHVVEALADQVGGDAVARHLAHGVFEERQAAEFGKFVEQQQQAMAFAPPAAVRVLALHQAVDGLAGEHPHQEGQPVGVGLRRDDVEAHRRRRTDQVADRKIRPTGGVFDKRIGPQ